MRFLLMLVFGISFGQVFAQCKTFTLMSNGDTLNCIEVNDKKRGKWKLHVNTLRGNPGYDEEGEFRDNKKEGVWRKYSSMGDLLAIQNYKWGNLDGTSQYFTIAGLDREENWHAMNPEKAFDTLQVEDINDENKYVQVIVPNDGKSMKHGKWTWYRTGSENIIKTEVYFLNKLKEPKDDKKDIPATIPAEPVKKVPPKEVADFDKKNSGKKSVKTRDGRVGG